MDNLEKYLGKTPNQKIRRENTRMLSVTEVRSVGRVQPRDDSQDLSKGLVHRQPNTGVRPRHRKSAATDHRFERSLSLLSLSADEVAILRREHRDSRAKWSRTP